MRSACEVRLAHAGIDAEHGGAGRARTVVDGRGAEALRHGLLRQPVQRVHVRERELRGRVRTLAAAVQVVLEEVAAKERRVVAPPLLVQLVDSRARRERDARAALEQRLARGRHRLVEVVPVVSTSSANASVAKKSAKPAPMSRGYRYRGAVRCACACRRSCPRAGEGLWRPSLTHAHARGYRRSDSTAAGSASSRWRHARHWRATPLASSAQSRCVIGSAKRFPSDNLDGDMNAACRWDCYRRAAMLEPLAAHVFERRAGDFMEAGVFKGGIAIVMTALLLSEGAPRPRTMWMADSFQGLPRSTRAGSATRRPPAVRAETSKAKWHKGRFSVPERTVKSTCTAACQQRPMRPWCGRCRATSTSRCRARSSGSLLRIDADMYTSIMDVLERVYNLMAPGGFVVFDDYKFPQAQRAIEDFRARRAITAPLQFPQSDVGRDGVLADVSGVGKGV